jgi:SAM-dependent methyltransferase
MFWDEKFSADHYIYGTDPNDFLAAQVGAIPKGKVLCIGDGEGRNGVFLAMQGYQVTSVDSSRVGLAKAQKLAAENDVTLKTVLADLNDFDIGNAQWDGVVSIYCHLPEPLRQKVHGNVVRGLKPQGVLLLEAYTPKQLEYNMGGPPVVELMYTADILRSDLAGLEFEHLQELDREVIEGTHHYGMGAVVQLIGVKP